jgi:hypothetical protein
MSCNNCLGPFSGAVASAGDDALTPLLPGSTGRFVEYSKGPYYQNKDGFETIPMYIKDTQTEKLYFNESKVTVRSKCLGLIFFNPVANTVFGIANVTFRILRLLSLSHFWIQKNHNKSSFKDRCTSFAKDLLRIALTPIILIALEVTAMYGLFKPLEARATYAAIERKTYGKIFINRRLISAPCFQASPKGHFFGGDVNIRNAF